MKERETASELASEKKEKESERERETGNEWPTEVI